MAASFKNRSFVFSPKHQRPFPSLQEADGRLRSSRLKTSGGPKVIQSTCQSALSTCVWGMEGKDGDRQTPSGKEKRSERRSLEPGPPGTPGNRERIDPSRHQWREHGSLHRAAKCPKQSVFIPLEGRSPSCGHQIKSQVLPNTRSVGVLKKFGRTRLSPLLNS